MPEVYASTETLVELLDPITGTVLKTATFTRDYTASERPVYIDRGYARSALGTASRTKSRGTITLRRDAESLALVEEIKRWQKGVISYPLTADLKGRTYRHPHLRLTMTNADGTVERQIAYGVRLSDRSISRQAGGLVSESISLDVLRGFDLSASDAAECYEPKPALAFHRTGSASHLALDGTLTTAGDGVARLGLPWVVRRNLLAWSEDLTQAAWVKTNVTIERARALGVGALYTADQVTVGSSGQALYQDKTVLPLTTYTLSFYAQRGTATDVLYSIEDLTGGTTITGASYYASINSGGLTRVPVTFTTPAGCTSVRLFGVRGGAAGTVILTACQLDLGSSASSYQPTNATGPDLTNPINGAGLVLEGVGTNLLRYSQDFDNDAWAKQNADINANSATAPDDTSTADSIRRLAAGANHYVYQQAAVTSTSGKTYTFSLWLKLPGSSALPGNVVLRVRSGAGMEYGSATITPTTDWQRYAATAAFASGSAADVVVYLDPANDTGGGGEAIYAWGAQLEEGPFATSYIPTTSAAVARNADLCGIVPPHNLLKWSEGFDNAAWVAFTGASKGTVNSAVGPFGDLSADALSWGASNANNQVYQVFDAKPSTTYTVSCWVKRNAGTDQKFRLKGLTWSSGDVKSADFTATDTWQRFHFTFTTLANIGTDDLYAAIMTDSTLSAANLLVVGAQLVEGSHPSIYVRTTDTPIPAPTSPALDPAWQQNGVIEFRAVLGSEPPVNPKSFSLLGHNLAWRTGGYGVGDRVLTFDRSHDGATGTFGSAGREAIEGVMPNGINPWDGAPHHYRIEWTNYVTSGGTRVMTHMVYIDGVLAGFRDVAATYGASKWLTLDATQLLTGAAPYQPTHATLSDTKPLYPTIPAGATPAT